MMFTNLVSKLEMEYWVTHCGNDGYLYLLFQRRFLHLTLYLSVISISTSVAMNLLLPLSPQEDESQSSLSSWFDRAALQNKDFENHRSWFHVVMVLVYTFLTINAVQKTRRDARVSYQMYYAEMSKKKDHEWLKVRTLHIKGIPYEDRAGSGLRLILEQFLSKHGGSIQAL